MDEIQYFSANELLRTLPAEESGAGRVDIDNLSTGMDVNRIG